MLKTHVKYHHSLDKASRRTYTFSQKLLTFFRLLGKKQIERGKNTIIGRNVRFFLTDNAKLKIGNNSIIDDSVRFILTKPNPEVLIGNQVALSYGCVVAAKSKIIIGDYSRIGVGEIISNPCSTCRGQGRTNKNKKPVTVADRQTDHASFSCRNSSCDT